MTEYLKNYFYFCPVCGEAFCNPRTNESFWESHCHNKEGIDLVKSKHEKSYYGINWRVTTIAEISENPLFDDNEYKKRLIEEEEIEQQMRKIDQIEAMRANQNTPKCPTCGSANIQRISTASKVVGATLFGLLSKNATSQFKCNSCGYKW